MSETPPAGWYPDPQDDTKQRYWDGSSWTEHTAPAAQRSGATPASSATQDLGATTTSMAGGATSPATAPGIGGGRADVDAWTWQSIVVTILCCSPLGVAGALNAGRSEAAAKAGDRAAAERYAAQAKKWTLWGLGAWVAVIVLYFLFFAIVIGSSGFSEFQQF